MPKVPSAFGVNSAVLNAYGLFPRIVINVERAEVGVVVRQIEADAVHSIVLNIDQRIVAKTLERDRQSRGETGDPGDGPASRKAI